MDGEAREAYTNAWQGSSTLNADASMVKVEDNVKTMLVLECRRYYWYNILLGDYFWASNENKAYIRMDQGEGRIKKRATKIPFCNDVYDW